MKKYTKLITIILALTLFTSMAAPAVFAEDYTMKDIQDVYNMLGNIIIQSNDEITQNITTDENYLCSSVIITVQSMLSSGMNYSQQEINTAYEAIDATFSLVSLIAYKADTSGKKEEIVKQLASIYLPENVTEEGQALYNGLHDVLYDRASAYYSGLVQSVFDDVSEDDWFYDAVFFAYDSGLFKGTSENMFSPYATMTRGMFITVLSRFEGVDAVQYNNEFTDVSGEEYYAIPAAWAKSKNYIPWATQAQLSPDKPITREEIASSFYSMLGNPDMDTSYADSIKDMDSVSEYAVNAIRWAFSTGVMKGYEDGSVRAQGTATRAEVAQLFLNYMAVVFAPAE